MSEQSCILHASCIAFAGRGVVILGTSGAGKSALALQLMALGADLVADDQTCLRAVEGGVLASAPDPIRGLIEARGVGLLAAKAVATARVHLLVDLSQEEKARLPERHKYNLLGHSLPLLHKVRAAHFPAAILQYLKGGRSA